MIWSRDGGKSPHAGRRLSSAGMDHREAGTLRSRAKGHRAKGRERRASNDGLDGLFDELELKFDLMRLRRLRAELEESDRHLASEGERLSAGLLDTAGPRHLLRYVATRARLSWIANRRRALADRQRWFLILEGDLEFALRLRKIRRRR